MLFRSRYIIIDTPGQIEVFTWSASGSIITEALVGHASNVHSGFLLALANLQTFNTISL